MNDNRSECLMSVDCTDFKIQEPRPFNPNFFSHKINHAVFKYEVAVCIQTGWIVWGAGPFPAGDYSDLEVFCLYLKTYLSNGEHVECDHGYNGDYNVCTPSDYEGNVGWRQMKGQARARHEAINGKLKEFNILAGRSRWSR